MAWIWKHLILLIRAPTWKMVPYLEAALSGKTIHSQKIIDTTWGHIFTACYPVIASDGTNDILGALYRD